METPKLKTAAKASPLMTSEEIPATPLTTEEILGMRRSDIRYALYRCKKDNGDENHKLILAYYKDQLDEVGCKASDFAEGDGWDINKKDSTEVVTGRIVRKYIKDLLAPGF